MRISKAHLPFWIFSISIIIGLSLPILVQEGMFQDGVLYTCVSRNLAEGIGNFWFLQYSTLNLEGIPSFHEQPPLFFGIQAVFFWIFGDSIYVERVFTFVMLLMHFYLINELWKIIVSNIPKYHNFGWLPVFFWAIIPVSFWSFRHNMIENTMSLFILLAVILGYRSLKQGRTDTKSWIFVGIFIFFATFSQCVPGLFPLVLPMAFALAFRKYDFKSVIVPTLIMVTALGIIYSAILLFPDARESLSIYFYERLLRRVDTMPTVGHRFFIIYKLFVELLPGLMVMISLLVARRKQINSSSIVSMFGNDILFFVLLGLAGTLPLMLTMVQKSWYMLPALPFFAIAFALITLDKVEKIVKIFSEQYPTRFNVFSKIAYILFFSIIIFSITKIGSVSREKEIIEDVKTIGMIVPKHSTIGIPECIYDQYDFVLQGYLVRYFHISIDPYTRRKYFITLNDELDEVPSSYEQIPLTLKKYALFVSKGQ
ncbi:MAG: glycosyltransferase family 39 protein [Saprospiraceae bacterium]